MSNRNSKKQSQLMTDADIQRIMNTVNNQYPSRLRSNSNNRLSQYSLSNNNNNNNSNNQQQKQKQQQQQFSSEKERKQSIKNQKKYQRTLNNYLAAVASFRQKTLMTFLFFGLGVVLVIVLVAISGVLNWKEGLIRLNDVSVSRPPSNTRSSFPLSALPSNACTSFGSTNENLMVLRINVSQVEPLNQHTVSFNLEMFPCGDFASKDPFQDRFNLAVPANLTFDTQTFNIPPNLPPTPLEIRSNLATGNPDNYPFETYTSNLLQVASTTLPPRSSTPQRLPLQIFLVGALQGFKIETLELLDRSDNGDGTLLSLQIEIKRSRTTRLFSMFVVVLMWVLCLLTVVMAGLPWLKRRKVDIPTIAFGMGLLFALPAIRNAQPGVPPIGCVIDTISFFWSMIITAAAASLMLGNYLYFSNLPNAGVIGYKKQLRKLVSLNS
ncbi:hypothetical protein HDV05_007069 [Chytridiales sp. JEL 0842]|nr:hypothetical protein HDV05_007069 [Chytridiales sp. JEL 0842]